MLIKIKQKQLFPYYGLFKSKDLYQLTCLSPKIAFGSLQKEGYKKLILTSGSLPSKSVFETLTGLSLQPPHRF